MESYPLSDEYMIFNTKTSRYELTERDVLEFLGINLKERVKNENAIAQILKTVSLQTYSFIHQFNVNNDFQDFVLATTQKGREVIKSAMEQQLIYLCTVGDLSKTTDLDKRGVWFDEIAKEILLTPIPEIGTSICYSGDFFPIC